MVRSSLDILSRLKGIETQNCRLPQPVDNPNHFGDTFPVKGNRNFYRIICRKPHPFLLWRHFPIGRESKLYILQIIYSLLGVIFGDTFPREGNRNFVAFVTAYLSGLPFLWRHFPDRRESKRSGCTFVPILPFSTLETLSRSKGIETLSVRFFNYEPMIFCFGDTFPREGNRNGRVLAELLNGEFAFGDTFPIEGNRNGYQCKTSS